MKTPGRSLLATAIVGLAACSAAQNVSPNLGAGSSAQTGATRIVSDHGGKFRARYSGNVHRTGDCSATAMVTYAGSGKASARFLHSSNEKLVFTWFCGSPNFSGAMTLTSVRHPHDTVIASVTSNDYKDPCYGFTMAYTVTGGTGRYRHAAGSGTIVVNTTGECAYYPYHDEWKGTLNI